MGLEDILGGLGGLGGDAQKTMDLVHDLWESRAKILEAVNFVFEHKDTLGKAVGFIQDHADDLVQLGQQVPHFLGVAGGALGDAGEGAQHASVMLLGTSGNGIRELVEHAATALEACRDQLAEVTGLFQRTAESFAAMPLIGDVAKPFADGTQRFSGVADELGQVAGRLRQVGDSITNAGQHLANVGGALGSSGQALASFASNPAAPGVGAMRSFVTTQPFPDAPTTAPAVPAAVKPAKRAPAKKAPPATRKAPTKAAT